MLHNSSVAIKFFLGFFFTSAIAIASIMVVIYLTVKNNVIDTKVEHLSIIHNIKAKQLQGAIQTLESPVLKFFKNNYEIYGLDKIFDAYDNLPNNINSSSIEKCKQELSKQYAGQYNSKPILEYLNISSNYAVPSSNSGIIAQCINLMDKVGVDSIDDIDENATNITSYKDITNNFSNAFSLILDTAGFENILFVSANDEVVYAPKESSILGHNVVLSYWIKGLSNQITKFHSMSDKGDSYYFIDMQPYMPLYGYPAFFIIAPIFKNNKYYGSIVLVLSSLFIDSILSDNNKWEDEGLGTTGDAYITTNDGIFRSNKRSLIEKPHDTLLSLKKIENIHNIYKMIEHFGTVAYYSPIISNFPIDVYEGNSGYGFSKTVTGTDVIIYYSPLNIGNLKWTLFTSMELEEILSEITPIKTLMYNMIIPVIVILVTITATFSYFITRPIRQMQRSCIAIADGQSSSMEDVEITYKEINDIVNAFNDMSINLLNHEKQTEKVKNALENSLFTQTIISRELKEEKDFISRILDAKGLLIFVIDDNDKIIRINNAVQSFYPEKDLLGMNYEKILPNEYRHRIVTIVSLIRGGDKHIPHLITELKNNNKIIRIEWNFSVFTSDNDNNKSSIQYISAIGIDITERYKADKSSKENAAMFHRIFSNAYDAILIADENNNILLVNKSFESLFEVDYVDLVGKSVIGNVISNEYENIILLDNQDGKSLELEALHSNKSKFPVDVSISKIKYKGKLSILYMLRDSSSKKKKEQELQIALKRATDAERTKAQFIDNMSYEIQTILNGIMGFIDLLKETHLDSVQRKYFKIINASSDSLFGIINDILDFSKIENGKVQIETIEFNLYNVFEDSLDIYATKAMEKNILLICLFNIDMPRYFLGDSLRIKQIITNLVSNAVKYTDINGRVILRATLISQDEEICKIRISIKDNGIGITKENQEKILNTFSKIDIPTSHQYTGSGLGLVISKSLINSMNSSLKLYSEFGKGSEFYFTLELPFINKKETQLNNDFSNTSIMLLGYDENIPERELYEEYIKNVKAQVKYTTQIEDIDSQDVKIVGIIYINIELSLLKDMMNKHNDKHFIIFCMPSISNDIYDLSANNVHILIPPLNIHKLILILSDILGYNKHLTTKHKKTKNMHFSGNIMLVDDNEINSKLSEILLENMGLNVEIAENGQIAVDKYKKEKYDLIFMDIYMPVKDGLTATKEIVEYEEENNIEHTPIVALTANLTESDIEECTNMGMDDFVEKPIVKSKLESVLNRYLNNEYINIDDIIKGIKEYLKTDDQELAISTLKEYCKMSWHYVQILFHAVSEYNDGSSLYIINKMLKLSEKYKISSIINAVKKIEQNIENGMNENILISINELKDIIYAIKYSIR